MHGRRHDFEGGVQFLERTPPFAYLGAWNNIARISLGLLLLWRLNVHSKAIEMQPANWFITAGPLEL